MARESNAPTKDDLELRAIKLDLIDSLSPMISAKELYVYDEDIKALLKYPLNERARRFNMLVQKIREQHKEY